MPVMDSPFEIFEILNERGIVLEDREPLICYLLVATGYDYQSIADATGFARRTLEGKAAKIYAAFGIQDGKRSRSSLTYLLLARRGRM